MKLNKNQCVVRKIGNYDLFVEKMEFGKVSFMFAVIYKKGSNFKNEVVGYYDTKKELLEAINDFIKRYTNKDGFHPFTLSQYVN